MILASWSTNDASQEWGSQRHNWNRGRAVGTVTSTTKRRWKLWDLNSLESSGYHELWQVKLRVNFNYYHKPLIIMNCDSVTTILGSLSINLGCHWILIDATLNWYTSQQFIHQKRDGGQSLNACWHSFFFCTWCFICWKALNVFSRFCLNIWKWGNTEIPPTFDCLS